MGFFDKMTVAIGSAGKDVAQMAKDASEVSRCTVAIEECEQKIKDISEKVGQYFYENHTEYVEEPYKSWFAEIDENVNTIKEMKEKRRILKGIEICQNCGAELKKDANFCNECGARVERDIANSISLTRCPGCGSILKGHEKFCAKCGTKIEGIQLVPELPAGKIICAGCGRELKEGHAFCQYCGTAVKKDKTEESDADKNRKENDMTE